MHLWIQFRTSLKDQNKHILYLKTLAKDYGADLEYKVEFDDYSTISAHFIADQNSIDYIQKDIRRLHILASGKPYD